MLVSQATIATDTRTDTRAEHFSGKAPKACLGFLQRVFRAPSPGIPVNWSARVGGGADRKYSRIPRERSRSRKESVSAVQQLRTLSQRLGSLRSLSGMLLSV